MFNGFDSVDSKWEEMVPSVASYAQWLIANRQNRLEVVLLWAADWADFANSTLRQSRLNKLVEVMHSFGVAFGCDVPIAEIQQHAWHMVDHPDATLQVQKKEIEEHIDWWMAAGFDFISSENGFTEFTHANCTLALEWMNYATEYALGKYGKKMYIKCHCSSGQTCPDYKDPVSGKPINFNFLPYYATKKLGIYPHTVQFYNFTDPSPVYGNENFTYVYDWIWETKGEREVVYHGETAYWVNYDIDVPLFLPVYMFGRVSDLQRIGEGEKKHNQKIEGQINFSSGWEWTYWLNNWVTSRAAWNPEMGARNTYEAVGNILEPVTRMFGPNGAKIKALILDSIKMERELLIFGQVGNNKPETVEKRNGIGYLQGWDTWSDLMNLVSSLLFFFPRISFFF